MVSFACGIVGDHRQGPAIRQELAQAITVVGGVTGAHTCGRQWCEQGDGRSHIAELSRCYLEGDWAPLAVDNCMDFRRPAATGAADRL